MDYVRLNTINKKHLSIGETIYVKALVSHAKFKSTKDGIEYLYVEINDKSVKDNFVIFGVNPPIESIVDVGYVYNLQFTVSEYRGENQLKYVGMSRNLGENYDAYLNKIEDYQIYLDTIENMFNTLDLSKPVPKIAFTLYKCYEEDFKHMPASKTYHHNIIGGLLMHTSCMLKSIARLYKVYSYLDWELLSCIALLHDIGKVKEYSLDKGTGKIGFTTVGSLKGHIMMTVTDIEILAKKFGVSEDYKVLALINGVASHHGKLAHGSPVIPYTAEAKMVHAIDSLDAVLYRHQSIVSSLDVGELEVKYLPNGEMEGYYKFRSDLDGS